MIDTNAMDVPRTRLEDWRLELDEGRHNWAYYPNSTTTQPQSLAEKYFLGLPTDFEKLAPAQTPAEAAENGARFLDQIQLSDGHWGCDYGGACFLTTGLVFALYITESPIPKEWAVEISRQLVSIVNEDGGWGMHEADPQSTTLATALHYVVLRILGMKKDHPVAVRAREKLRDLGGATALPHWGKVWLAALNLYLWEGVRAVPPEPWLQPDWSPFHPWRWWIHGRVVYLAMSYIYRLKFQMPANPLILALREELYTLASPYATSDFKALIDHVSPADLKYPMSPIAKLIYGAWDIWETYLQPSRLSSAALETVYSLILQEDQNTDGNCLAPVNKAWHMVAIYAAEGPNSSRLQSHHEKLKYYWFLLPTGMRSGGTNGTQVWDVSFITNAYIEAGLAHRHPGTMQKALEFLEAHQLRDDLDDPYRQQRKGGWPFSTKDNGYIVSDCAAEALRSVLDLQRNLGLPRLISDDRICDCVDTLLTMQNTNGGFSTYEPVRTFSFLNVLNPTGVFADTIVEPPYVECTGSVVAGLCRFRGHFPGYRPVEIRDTIARGVKFVKTSQRADGSWYGSWGVCFTYAAQFALEGLALAGEHYGNSATVRGGCEFLVSHQRADGAWGEHWKGCELGFYVEHEEGQVVNTAWALIALMHAKYPRKEVLEKGVKYLVGAQQGNGEWKQGEIEGVFSKTCIIGYPNYRLCFPIKALGMYARLYGNEEAH